MLRSEVLAGGEGDFNDVWQNDTLDVKDVGDVVGAHVNEGVCFYELAETRTAVKRALCKQPQVVESMVI